MAKLQVERIGGLAGFGSARAHIRSQGAIDSATLSTADQQAVERLFQAKGRSPPSPARDTFRYRISRTTADGVEITEVPEEDVPAALCECVKDELI